MIANAGHAPDFLHALPMGSVCAVIGLPRTGKSSAVRAADLLGAFPRRVVFDPYAFRAIQTRKPMWRGDVRTPDVLAHYPDLLDVDPLAITVAPESLDPRHLGLDFALVSELIWNTGGVDLICEEAGLYLGGDGLQRDAGDLLQRVASGAQHAQCRLIIICQSLTRLSIRARRHLSAVVAFATAPADHDELRGMAGPEFVDTLARMDLRSPPLLWLQGHGASPALSPAGKRPPTPEPAREEA